jgi:outer membrane protein W
MKLALSFVALAVSSTATGLALAQPPGSYEATYLTPERPSTTGGRLPAPANAVELSVATGYSQPFGDLSGGIGFKDVAKVGIGVDVGVGYRIDPKWGVSWFGQYQEFNAERADAARAFTTSLAAQYHFNPYRRLDPWVELGAGYKFFLEDPTVGKNVLTHGFQLGRLRAGLDFRAAEAVALGPIVGADATLFLFQDAPNAQTNISDPRVSTFVYAGLQGRFDIGIAGTARAPTVATR